MASKLPTREVGKSGLKASKLGFGCMSLTDGFYGSGVDVVETEKTLRKALDLGITLINTADFYTSFTTGDLYQNISLIGKVLKDYPKNQAVITMKWGPWIVPGKGFQPSDLSAAGCRKRVDDAISILGVDYIDVLVFRFLPQSKSNVSLEETARGMKDVVDSGKVKAIGVSEASVEQLKTIHSIVPVSLIELEWSLFARDSESSLVPAAREIGAGFLAYSPLGRGMLTGSLDKDNLAKDDFRRTHSPQFSEEAYDHNAKLAGKVKELAAKKGCTSGQLALAWVLAQGDDVIPIPGTKRIKYLEENLGALDVKLTKEDIERLSEAVPKDSVKGGRY